MLRRRGLPSVQGALDEVALGATVAQAGIDLFQALPEGLVVHIADDGGQLRVQFLREGNNLTGPGDSLYTSADYASKNCEYIEEISHRLIGREATSMKAVITSNARLRTTVTTSTCFGERSTKR